MTIRSLLRGTAFWFGFIIVLFWVNKTELSMALFWRGWLLAFGLSFLQGLHREALHETIVRDDNHNYRQSLDRKPLADPSLEAKAPRLPQHDAGGDAA
jgi:hypothetical protein